MQSPQKPENKPKGAGPPEQAEATTTQAPPVGNCLLWFLFRFRKATVKLDCGCEVPIVTRQSALESPELERAIKEKHVCWQGANVALIDHQ